MSLEFSPDRIQAGRSTSPISQCLISFGSNLGDRRNLIADAASRIAESDIVCRDGASTFRASRLFETPPIGGPGGQDPFLNAVASFETSAPASEVLSRLQAIEDELGRLRRRRWDARTIDLDVVLHGQLVGGSSALTVPHPRYTARQFVLRPACDVAADYRDPRFGWSLRRLADHLSAAVPSLVLVGADISTRVAVCQRLAELHGLNARGIDSAGSAENVGLNIGLPADEPSQEENLDQPWVTPLLPNLPDLSGCEESEFAAVSSRSAVPRLIVRIQRSAKSTTGIPSHEKAPVRTPAHWAGSRWPAPHQIWPAGWRWPEYRLEFDDVDWAVGELASAIESMQCPVAAVTQDGQWW